MGQLAELAELAGLEYSEHLQGKSLVKTLDDPEYKVRDMAFSVTQGGKTFLLRDEKWAYIQYDEDAASGIELFDMINDPGETTNLAANPTYALQLQNHRDFFADWLTKTDDTYTEN